MSLLTILIVDDEQPARKKLSAYLQREEGVRSLIEAENGVQAVEMIETERPDLVFLDIQMPGMTGFDVIETVGADRMPAVVFVTAYDQYAIDAFDVQAVDYLLKPYDNERFKKAFDRAVDRVKRSESSADMFNGLVASWRKNGAHADRFLVSKGSAYVFVQAQDIMYISAAEKYVELHTESGLFLMRDSMNNMESRVDSTIFKRIHRSHIVNLRFVKEIQPWGHGDYAVIMQNGDRLNLSRRYRDRVFDEM